VSVSVDSRIGTEFLGYRIEALLGRGGMSVVYRAEHLRLKRKVALKLLAPELGEDAHFRERFLRESELAASLDHPHIVPIYDAGELDGQLYIAMRYVAGGDLRNALKEGPLDPGRTLALLAQVADALDAAHEAGLVHRDVKPGNVLLDSREHCYLSDFGLTKQVSSQSGFTATGQLVGTIDYVAPEVIEGKELAASADLYSLGCLLFACLAGEAPFHRGSEFAVLWAHVNEPPPKLSERRPEVPAELEAVVAKALAKAPERRYASGRELIEAARRALPAPAPQPPKRRRLLLAVVAIAAAALAVVLPLSLTGSKTGPSAIATASLRQIDPATNRVAATIEIGSDPSGIAVGAGAVWVTDMDDNTLSRIDLETHAVKTVPVSPSPNGVAAAEGVVWVVTSSGIGASLLSIEPTTFAIRSTSRVPSGPVAVGDGTVWTGGNLVLSHWAPRLAYTGEPAVLNLGYSRTADPTEGLAVGEGAVWVANAALEKVLRIDLDAKQVVAEIELDFAPSDVAAGPGGVWVSDGTGNSVVRIDPATNRVRQMIRVGRRPFSLAVGEGAVWVANSGDGTVSRIDPQRGTVVSTIRVGQNPNHITAGAGGVWTTLGRE
jgi:YVTN family beta-propeller protein